MFRGYLRDNRCTDDVLSTKSLIYIYESRGNIFATRYIVNSREIIFVKEREVSATMMMIVVDVSGFGLNI